MVAPAESPVQRFHPSTPFQVKFKQQRLRAFPSDSCLLIHVPCSPVSNISGRFILSLLYSTGAFVQCLGLFLRAA